jgi:hypothetical protein
MIPVCLFAQKEIKVTSANLPAAVNTELNRKYKKYTVMDITILTDKKQNVFYSLSLTKNNTMIDMVYDSVGKQISKNKYKVFFGKENNGQVQPLDRGGHNHQQNQGTNSMEGMKM